MSSLPVGLPALGAVSYPGAQAIQAAIQGMGLGMTGIVYYLDPALGDDHNNGLLPTSAVATLAEGYARLRSGYNDVLVLIGNGTSTGTARIATFTWAKNAAHLIGVCAPSQISQRARIANATTAGLTMTANFFTVSGNGCLFQNLSWFHGAGAGQTGIASDICLTVSGTRNAFINCHMAGMGDSTSATSSGSRNILVTAGENYFGHCFIGIDTVQRTNANASVEIKSGANRTIFEDCIFPFWSTDGLQYGLLVAAASGMDRMVMFKGCNAYAANSGGATAIAAFLHLAANAGGIVCFDNTSGLYNITAIGDATSKAQTFVSGGTATNGVKGIVAT